MDSGVDVIWIARIAAWLVMMLISSLGAIIGLPVVGLLAWRRSWARGTSPVGKAIWVWAPEWAYPWSDSDQGIDPALIPTRWGAFYFVGIRNKVSNLRMISPFGFRIEPARIRSIGTALNLYLNQSGWSLTWHGIYAGYWLKSHGWELRIGWALIPDDARGINLLDMRQLYCPFSVQLHRQK